MTILRQTLRQLSWAHDLRQIRHRRQEPPVTHGQAAQALFYLNRVAKTIGAPRSHIYSIKTAVLAAFVQRGLDPEVHIKHYELKCFNCNGTGWYSVSQECRRCYGTGVYATHLLLELTFSIHGLPYTWHQHLDRASQIGVLAANKVAEGNYRAPEHAPVETNPCTIQWNLALLVVYLTEVYSGQQLALEGVDQPPQLLSAEAEALAGYGKSIPQTLTTDLRWLWASARSRAWYGRKWFIQFCPDCHRPDILFGRQVGKHSLCDIFPF